MQSQDAVSATKTSKIMERMRFLGSFTVGTGPVSNQEILRKLALSDLDDNDVIEGFYQLVEEGSIRSHPMQLNLGMNGDLIDPQPVIEDVIMYSVV